MGKLKFYSTKSKKFNKPSTLPFNISIYRYDMIICNHLFERTKSKLCTIIIFCFIYNLVLL